MPASMRPRHKAAENRARRWRTGHDALQASMRPRHKAAENRLFGGPPGPVERRASMRPRHKAAENAGDAVGLDGVEWELQ